MTSFRVYLPFVSYIVARYSLSTLMACILVLPWRLRFVFQMSSVYNVLSRSVPLVPTSPRFRIYEIPKASLRFHSSRVVHCSSFRSRHHLLCGFEYRPGPGT